MKKLILLIGVIAFTLVSCENEKDILAAEVPSLVLNTFKTQFPNAADVEWEKKDGDYFVDFEIENIDHNSKFSSDGNLLKYKYDLLSTELPKLVFQTIQTEYPDKIVDEAEALIIGEKTYYQVEFEGGITDSHKIFDETGKEATSIEYWH